MDVLYIGNMKIITSEDIQNNIKMAGLINEMAKAYLILEDNQAVMPVDNHFDLEITF